MKHKNAHITGKKKLFSSLNRLDIPHNAGSDHSDPIYSGINRGLIERAHVDLEIYAEIYLYGSLRVLKIESWLSLGK